MNRNETSENGRKCTVQIYRTPELSIASFFGILF